MTARLTLAPRAVDLEGVEKGRRHVRSGRVSATGGADTRRSPMPTRQKRTGQTLPIGGICLVEE
jgi:hypothetical protein